MVMIIIKVLLGTSFALLKVLQYFPGKTLWQRKNVPFN